MRFLRDFLFRLFMKKSSYFSDAAVDQLAQADVARALAEDLGTGDLTAALIDPDRQARARVLARESAVVCGRAWVEAAPSSAPTARVNRRSSIYCPANCYRHPARSD